MFIDLQKLSPSIFINLHQSSSIFISVPSYATKVPTWAIQAKNEISYQPPNILRTKFYNLLNVTVLDDGGHFLAFELPKVFTEDVFKAVKAFRVWHKQVLKSEL